MDINVGHGGAFGVVGLGQTALCNAPPMRVRLAVSPACVVLFCMGRPEASLPAWR